MKFAKWINPIDKTITAYNEQQVCIRNTLVAKSGDIIEVHAKFEALGEKKYVCKGTIIPTYFWANYDDLVFCDPLWNADVQQVHIVA